TALRIAIHCSTYDAPKLVRDFEVADIDVLIHGKTQNLSWRCAELPRAASSDHLDEDQTERIDVATDVDRLRHHPLGRHIGGCADNHALRGLETCVRPSRFRDSEIEDDHVSIV